MSEIKYKAAKYIRLSYTDDKDNESDSVVNQRKFLDSFIESQPDIEAVIEMVDDGYSGIPFDRPAFLDMMRQVEEGKINCVIVKDLSRLGRDHTETGRYLRRIFPTYGVRFIAVNDNIDTLKDSGDDLAVSFKSIINDAYCRDISVKTRSALNAKRESGEYVGACAIYGYMKSEESKNRLAIDEYPASVVRDIFHMRINGMSAAKIAETLNKSCVLSPMEYKRDRGLPHPTGGFADKADAKWSATSIIRILRDETYTGTLIQGKQGTPNYKIRDVIDKPESEWIRTENAHEAIVHRHDFDLVQRIMKLDTRTAPDSDSVHIFSGVLICGCCGGRMTRKTVPYKGSSYFYYYCPTGKKRGCDHPVMLKESALSECILASIKSHVSNIITIESVLSGSDAQKAGMELARRYEILIAENERQLEKINGFKSSLYQNMINGILTKNDYKALKAGYIRDEARLCEAIASLQNERENALAGKSERLRWIEYFKQFEGLRELDRSMVVSLIQSIRVIGKRELQVTFNYQVDFEKALALVKANTSKGVA